MLIDCIGFMDEKGGLISLSDDKSMESAGKHFTHRTIYTLIAINSKAGQGDWGIPMYNALYCRER